MIKLEVMRFAEIAHKAPCLWGNFKKLQTPVLKKARKGRSDAVFAEAGVLCEKHNTNFFTAK